MTAHAEEKLLTSAERSALPYVKGVVTRLKNEVDSLATEGGMEDVQVHVLRTDPRIGLVKAVLDHAARALQRL